ncbi:N-acetylglutaminylglutamine synthetase [Notoacmeibacter sp. MSK16QG-6]|uniref:N-acetylglutaminylglutamine synthetase n=1 Tax=Notoacmeibacter sp. MSK16QG-6 TaxID=2957982 RepID=UPI00209EFAE7|nr:N-acetylglutaminylglutamine synthetase [Notoacmeibacter sp. MSK16QG-6]MCP1197818.1 N-acetylglutaminylglutamine synthetase [Notoacmeibacter sp. MSK16QG-6]
MAETEGPKTNYSLDCGWGRLVFGQTFENGKTLIETLRRERADARDIAVYVDDPHVLLSLAPHELFLDPSHTFRIDLGSDRNGDPKPSNFFIRRLSSHSDAEEVNRIYRTRGMVPVPPEFFWSHRDARALTYFVAEDDQTGAIIGTVTGVDHLQAFGDPERGSSLWCLAVDPQARQSGIGQSLVHRLAGHFAERNAAYMDLTVLHNNESAIALYEKLGFRRVSYFTVKRKNAINEQLFSGPEKDHGLNPYAKIIVDEARRRGIQVEVTDAEGGFFQLSYGGRTVQCRESLTEFTSAIAMSICDDKSVTRRVVEKAGVRVPSQITTKAPDDKIKQFLDDHSALVVKPARGEQGRGITVGVKSQDELEKAITAARKVADEVLIEEMVEGSDLRLVMINYKLVAAAIRKPAQIVGDGESTVETLIEHQSRRRSAATGGESRIPLDEDTRATCLAGGYDMTDVLPDGKTLQVRKTANLHTGGTIHDVTGEVHPTLVDAAVRTARAINIPVTGIDFMVKSPRGPDYAFIEANERPGLANHEPQPTAERFIDLLFPLSMPYAAREALRASQSELPA